MHIAINGLFLQRPFTGTGQYTIRLLSELPRLGKSHRYTLLGGSAQSRQNAFVAGFHSRGASPRMDGRYHDLQKVLWEQLGLPLHAASSGADILHNPYWASPVCSLQRTVVTIHDVIPALLPAYRGRTLTRTYTSLVALSARRADAIIADSDCTRRDIVRVLRIPASRVHTIHLAPGERFYPMPAVDAREIVRRRWSIDQPFFVYIGATDRRKDIPTLLRAWQQTSVRLPGHLLVLGGSTPPHSSPLYPDLPRIAEELRVSHRVRFIGAVDDEGHRALLSACDAFVFPSLYEGFGLPPLEAMASGAPVIAAAASSVPEVVGNAALLFPPGEVGALSDAMLRLAGDPLLRASARDAGIRQAGTFTWEKTAAQTLGVYEAVMDCRRRS